LGLPDPARQSHAVFTRKVEVNDVEITYISDGLVVDILGIGNTDDIMAILGKRIADGRSIIVIVLDDNDLERPGHDGTHRLNDTDSAPFSHRRRR
jgi:hypothetical protein